MSFLFGIIIGSLGTWFVIENPTMKEAIIIKLITALQAI